MPEITRRRTGELLRKLFAILIAAPDGLAARIALEKLASSVSFTEYEAGFYPSGSRRFEKIVRFATLGCAKAGWLVKQNGIWTITEAGRQSYNALADPEAFYKEACRLYQIWRAAREVGDQVADQTDEPENAPEKSARITFEEAEEQAWGEIEAYLATMNPFDVQQLVADLLKAMGYYPSWVSPPGPDGGVDIIAHPDPLGTKPPTIKVQVKREAVD